jgi:AcrR family transcriptional regulator
MNNQNNSKDKLLKCAVTLFSEKGYENTGISELVQMAGVTKPTLYYFFQSKEGIYQEILKQYYGRFNTILAEKSVYIPNTKEYDKDVYPILLKIVKAYFDFAQNNKEFYMMILSLSFSPPTAQSTIITKPYNIEQYKIITNLFKDISKVHGNLKDKESLNACHFVAMINANIAFWYQHNGQIDSNKAETIVHHFMHGIFV